VPSLEFMQSVLDPDTQATHVCLVEITHPALTPPLRVCSGGADLISVSRQFIAYPFSIVLPGEGGERAARLGRIEIDNVDPVIVATLRGLTTRPGVTLEVVLASAPDTIAFSWTGLKLGDPPYDGARISAELTPRDDSSELWPKQRYGPTLYPGLFD
jgi:hypothetical protein